MDKVTRFDVVMDSIKDGMTIAFGGFCGIGAPLKAIEMISNSGVKDLTVIAVVNSYPGGGFDLAPLFENGQVKKFICAHTGTCPEALAKYAEGKLEVVFFPMGTWLEKLRAGGGGLGGVLTPVGVGTLVEDGKQKINIDGRTYLVEKPLRSDIAFIKGYRADAYGNVEYRGVAINTNPVVAMSSDYTIAEVDEIVPVGEIEPIRVGTQSIFVKAVVQGMSYNEHQKMISDLWIRTGRIKENVSCDS